MNHATSRRHAVHLLQQETPRRKPPSWWPHLTHSHFVTSGQLQWHVQVFEGPKPDAPHGQGMKLAPCEPKDTALLLHGTGSSAHSWRLLAPLMARRMRVIAVDLPGHAHTHTPDAQPLGLPEVAAATLVLLRELGVQPSLLVGHSAGAAIALRMALDAEFTPREVVSINGAILPLQSPWGKNFLPMAKTLVEQRWAQALFAFGAALPGATRALLAGTGSSVDEETLRCYRELVTRTDHVSGVLRLMASWDLTNLAHDLPRLKVPLRLMTASSDRTLPAAYAARVRDHCPKAASFELPGLGHLAHEEDAGLVDRLMSH